MITLSTLTLLRDPAQLRALLDAPEAAPLAVEELLRYLTIVHAGLRRVAAEDLEVGGATIRAGEGIVIPLQSANRDPGAFPDPDRLDLGRGARDHVAFGYGIHQCLGQPLARVELQVALPALFTRFPGLRVTAPVDQLPFKDNASVYGVRELPVAW
jgi:cytochrome P450